jgi:hypothetical protein
LHNIFYELIWVVAIVASDLPSSKEYQLSKPERVGTDQKFSQTLFQVCQIKLQIDKAERESKDHLFQLYNFGGNEVQKHPVQGSLARNQPNVHNDEIGV